MHGAIWNRMEVGDGVTDFSVHRFDNRNYHRQHDFGGTVGYVEKIRRRASDG